MNRLMTALRDSTIAQRLGASFLGLALATLCTAGVVSAQENPDPSLLGVSRSQIEASGLTALGTSARGVNQSGSVQIPRSGFDIVNDGTTGTVLLRGVRRLPNGTCDGLTNDAYFLVHVAGRPGDADGDGSFTGNSGSCATRRSGNPLERKIVDGASNDVGLLTFDESVKLSIDRDCNGKADLTLRLSQAPGSPTVLQIDSDDYTSFSGSVGGQGDAWEAAVFPGAAYPGCV